MSTASWTGVLQIARSRLLTFTPPNAGTTLATKLGSTSTGSGSDGKLFLDMAPDDLTGLWAILRLIDAPVQGFDGGNLIRGQLELICYGRPRRMAAQVRACADTAQMAWKYYSYTETNGVFIADHVTSRFTIPYAEPADRELVAERLLLPFRVVPSFLLSITSA